MKNPSPGENVQVERQGFTGIQNKRQQTSTKICGDGLFSWGSWQRLFQAPAVCSTPVTPACVKKAGLRHHLRMFGFSVPIFYFGNFPATPNKVELTADRSGQFWLGGGQESKPYQHKPTDPKRYYFWGALFKHQNNQKRAPKKYLLGLSWYLYLPMSLTTSCHNPVSLRIGIWSFANPAQG